MGIPQPTHNKPAEMPDDFSLIPATNGIHPCLYNFFGLPRGALPKWISDLDEKEFDKAAADINWDVVAEVTDWLANAEKVPAPTQDLRNVSTSAEEVKHMYYLISLLCCTHFIIQPISNKKKTLRNLNSSWKRKRERKASSHKKRSLLSV